MHWIVCPYAFNEAFPKRRSRRVPYHGIARKSPVHALRTRSGTVAKSLPQMGSRCCGESEVAAVFALLLARNPAVLPEQGLASRCSIDFNDKLIRARAVNPAWTYSAASGRELRITHPLTRCCTYESFPNDTENNLQDKDTGQPDAVASDEYLRVRRLQRSQGAAESIIGLEREL